MSGRIVKVPGMGDQEIELGGFALLLMLVGILAPPVMYAIRLNEPTPPQLLIAISISMFASVLYLWVLDITSTIEFRAAWASRAIYGAAIVSILGTSVGVYKDAFADVQFPYQGEWLVTVHGESQATLVAQRPVSLVYSQATGVYWGYGAPPEKTGTPESPQVWVEVLAFDPGGRRLEVRVRDQAGLDEVLRPTLADGPGPTTFASASDDNAKYRVQLARRN